MTGSGPDIVEVAELPYANTDTGFAQRVLAVTVDSPVRSAAGIAPGSRFTMESPNITHARFERLGIPSRSRSATAPLRPRCANSWTRLRTSPRRARRFTEVIPESPTRPTPRSSNSRQ